MSYEINDSVYNLENILHVTPSIEEVFAIFTAWAFLNEVIENTNEVHDFWWKDTELLNLTQVANLNPSATAAGYACISFRDRFVVWIVLVICTAVIGL